MRPSENMKTCTRVLKPFTSRDDPNNFSKMGPRIGETHESLVPFGDGGEDLIVEVGSECLDVVDKVAELLKAHFGLPE